MTALSISMYNGGGTGNTGSGQIAGVNGGDASPGVAVTAGTSAPGAGDFEFRFNLTDTNSNVITRVEAVKALLTFKMYLESMATYTTTADQ